MPAERKAEKKSARVRLYVAVTVGLSIVVSAWLLLAWGQPQWGAVGLFWCLHSLTLLDRVEVPVERLSILREERPRGVVLTPAFVVLFTAAFATDPSTALIVAAVPGLPMLLDRDRDWLKILFNSSQEAIYVGVASNLFALVRSINAGVLGSFAAAGLAATVALSLNAIFVAGVVAAERGVSLREVMRRLSWTVPHSIGFGLIALMVATLYRDFGVAAAIFLFMPLAALRVARQAQLHLDATRERTLTEFVRAVEDKDPYTYRHSERVAAIAVELHRQLGANPAHLERRWTAALLHDVGKVAVPAGILSKPGPLTPDEYEAIKEHPGVGAAAVREIDLFADLAPEVLYHHERLDGRGYPRGLAGEDIPFEARVLAVADAFEALTSDRPYRQALSASQALAELRRTAGQHHEAELVEALASVLDRGVSFVRPEPSSRAAGREDQAVSQ